MIEDTYKGSGYKGPYRREKYVEYRENYMEQSNPRDLRSLYPGFRGFNGNWDTFQFGNITAGQLYEFYSNYSRFW